MIFIVIGRVPGKPHFEIYSLKYGIAFKHYSNSSYLFKEEVYERYQPQPRRTNGSIEYSYKLSKNCTSHVPR